MPTTALPDGELARRYQVCDSAFLTCPKCNRPLRRWTAGEGSGWGHCDRPDPRNSGRPCGATLYVVATQGVATVVLATRADYERLNDRGLQARAILAELGILPPRRSGC